MIFKLEDNAISKMLLVETLFTEVSIRRLWRIMNLNIEMSIIDLRKQGLLYQSLFF